MQAAVASLPALQSEHDKLKRMAEQAATLKLRMSDMSEAAAQLPALKQKFRCAPRTPLPAAVACATQGSRPAPALARHSQQAHPTHIVHVLTEPFVAPPLAPRPHPSNVQGSRSALPNCRTRPCLTFCRPPPQRARRELEAKVREAQRIQDDSKVLQAQYGEARGVSRQGSAQRRGDSAQTSRTPSRRGSQVGQLLVVPC